jgi:oligopeptide/dipeptide ABC transporter ATP-binding protein
MTSLLEVRGLTVAFETEHGEQVAVDGVEFALGAGETLALVGESGCGKSLTALALLDLLPPRARIVAGEARFRGRDLLCLGRDERRALAGRELAMTFQEPGAALHPLFPVGEQIAEGLRQHAGLSRRAADLRAVELLEEVGLARAGGFAQRYPQELSGGQAQRAFLAMALAAGPALLIADEPTSALDPVAQAEILALLARLKRQRELALLLITHDLAVVAELAERMAVLYAGRVVETGGVRALLERPRHPYTLGLLRSRRLRRAPPASFAAIPGQVPDAREWPRGCRFHPRCALADGRCGVDVPLLLPAPLEAAPRAQESERLRAPDPNLALSTRRVACHHATEVERP